jgi:hypothetical protein
MISLMDVFSLQDCAAEALTEGAAQGLWSEGARDAWLDLIAASMNRKPITYDGFMARTIVRDLHRVLASMSEDPSTPEGTVEALAERCEAGDIQGIRTILEKHLDPLAGQPAPEAERAWQTLYLRLMERHWEALRSLERDAVRLEYQRHDEFRVVLDPFWNYERLAGHVSAHLRGRSGWKLICTGAGGDFRRLLAEGIFGNNQVVAVVDSHRPVGERIGDVPVIRLESIRGIEADAIIVTSSRWDELLRRSAVEATLGEGSPMPVI